MSLMPLHVPVHFTLFYVYVCTDGVMCDVSTSECILRMQLRTVYEQTLQPNANATILRTLTVILHPTLCTSYILQITHRNVHHIAYCIQEHYISFPPLFMRHHTNLF